MSKKIGTTTQQYLIDAALPDATETYTVIPHEAIIKETKAALLRKGLEVRTELYKCTMGASVAQGIYHLSYGSDPDMGMMFAWSNSYNKSMRFKCSIGGYVHTSLSSVIGSNMGTWGRKHTGTADSEAFKVIAEQIEHAGEYFERLVQDKEVMKLIPLSETRRAQILGRMFLEFNVLTTEQISIVKKEVNKPSFNYSGVENSVWAFYNSVIYSLQRSHPQTWMDQQRIVHWLIQEETKGAEVPICNEILLGWKPDQSLTQDNRSTTEKPHVDPAQLDLVVESEKMEAQNAESVEEIHEQIEEEERRKVELKADSSDDTWPCMCCGKNQGSQDAWNEGQLCTQCFQEQEVTND